MKTTKQEHDKSFEVQCRHPDVFKTEKSTAVVDENGSRTSLLKIEKGFEHSYTTKSLDAVEFTCSVKDAKDQYVVLPPTTRNSLATVLRKSIIPVSVQIGTKNHVFYLPLQHGKTLQQTFKDSKLVANLLALKLITKNAYIEMWIRPVSKSVHLRQLTQLKTPDLMQSYETVCSGRGLAANVTSADLKKITIS
jgi:hypothetical protein